MDSNETNEESAPNAEECEESGCVDSINVAQEEKELASDIAANSKNPTATKPKEAGIFDGYCPGSQRSKMDLLPFETQKEVIDLYLGTSGKKKVSSNAICKHLKKMGISIAPTNIQKWLEKRSADLYRDMISEKNEEIISGSYAELLTGFVEANRIMMDELRNLSHIGVTRRGKVQDMKYCFDSLQSGLTELRSHMENSKTSDYRSTKKLIDEITEEAQDIGIIDLGESPKSPEQ